MSTAYPAQSSSANASATRAPVPRRSGSFVASLPIARRKASIAAAAAFRQALAITPDYLPARRQLAAVLAADNDIVGAADCYRAVLQQAPLSGLDRREAEARSSAPAAPSADVLSRAMPRPEEKLGTGHGEREASVVTWTDFRRASEAPSELISIYYDSRANLIARGIIPGRSQVAPNPFPGFRFAPDPRG